MFGVPGVEEGEGQLGLGGVFGLDVACYPEQAGAGVEEDEEEAEAVEVVDGEEDMVAAWEGGGSEGVDGSLGDVGCRLSGQSSFGDIGISVQGHADCQRI